MGKYYPVEVVTRTDECGQVIPDYLIWNRKTKYLIERILHVCQPEDQVVRYTIKVDGKQRNLYSNGIEWRISNPV